MFGAKNCDKNSGGRDEHKSRKLMNNLVVASYIGLTLPMFVLFLFGCFVSFCFVSFCLFSLHLQENGYAKWRVLDCSV